MLRKIVTSLLFTFALAGTVMAAEPTYEELLNRVDALESEVADMKENYVSKDEFAEFVKSMFGGFGFTPTEEEAETETAPQTKEAEVSETSCTFNGFTFEYLSNELYTRDDGEYVILHFNYTNNSGQTSTPYYSLNVNAFQNGVRLQSSMLFQSGIEAVELAFTEIQDGTTVEIGIPFQVKDHSDISMEIGPMMRTEDQVFKLTVPIE